MIYEFAVDPACLSDWQTFRYLIEKFGVSQGRLISAFPRKWLKLVYASCGEFTFRQKQILQSELSRVKKYGLCDSSRIYDGELGWLENALIQHGIKPFHAIISTEDDEKNQVVAAAEMTEANPLWGTQRTMIVPRKAEDMAASVNTLLLASKHIILIDPHFGPENARHRRPFQAFLQVAAQNRSNGMPTVEVHAQIKSTEEFFRDECRTKLVNLIPTGLTVRFVRWVARDGGQPLHNRYILTDLGGVSFQHGLDDGRPGETDDVALLDRDSYEQRWAEYATDDPAFDLIEEPFELIGQ